MFLIGIVQQHAIFNSSDTVTTPLGSWMYFVLKLHHVH